MMSDMAWKETAETYSLCIDLNTVINRQWSCLARRRGSLIGFEAEEDKFGKLIVVVPVTRKGRVRYSSTARVPMIYWNESRQAAQV